MESEKKAGDAQMEEEQKLHQQSMIDNTAEEREIETATDHNIFQTDQEGSPSPRKKLKITISHEDRLSNLPNCITSHILSQLSTRDAVATSILSRNWRYKYTSIYNIWLNVGPLEERVESFQSLRSCLNRLLVLNDPSYSIQRFCFLISTRISSENIQEWITAAFRRNVENLEIWASLTGGSASLQCFSGWTSLTELILSVECTLGVTAMNFFPNLKRLCLRNGVQVNNEESQHTSRVIMTFTVLEVLELFYCKWANVDTVEMEAPKLIKFTSQSFEEKIPIFHINAPSATYAYLDHHDSDDFGLWALTVLKGFQNLTFLKLPGRCLEDFVTSKRMFGFPLLGQLEELEIELGSVYTAVLMEFLDKFPSLQSISMYGMIARAPPGNDAQIVKPLPLCIRSHLKKFRYYIFEGRMSVYDLALVKSILKNAKNLQNVILLGNDDNPAEILMQHFSKLTPEGSSYALSTEESFLPYTVEYGTTTEEDEPSTEEDEWSS